MEKILKIGGIDCRLKSSAAVPRLYRIKFGEDLIIDMNRLFDDVENNNGKLLPEDITILEQFCYICHKHGDETQPESIEEWLEQFEDSNAIYLVLNELIGLWSVEVKQKSTAKKKNVNQPEN